MTKQVKSFFVQPYPYYYKGKNLWYFAIIIFCMSLFFNFLFEPFVVYRPEHKMSYFWISFVHSFNAFLIVILIFGFANRFVNEDSWKVWNETVLFGSLLLMIGISQFLVRDFIYDNPNNWTWMYFFEEIRNTFLVGTLFVLILMPLNYIRLNRAHLKAAAALNSQPKIMHIPVDNRMIPIITQQKSDDFELNPDQLVFAKAEGNYLELFLENKNQSSKLLKRMTLKELETQLETYPQFFKTHRSYLVNLQKVREVKGNAQGYQLHLKDYAVRLPVSRGMIADFESKYKIY